MDDVPIRAGVGGGGKPQTFEELLARKLSHAQHPIASTASQQHSSPSRSPSSSHKPAKRVSFTHSTHSPLSRSQRHDEVDSDGRHDEESKVSSAESFAQEEQQQRYADGEMDEYRRIEDTLRALRVEAEMEAMDDSKYDDYDDDDDRDESVLHSAADLARERDSTEEAVQADDANGELETEEDDSMHGAHDRVDSSKEEVIDVEAEDDGVNGKESAEERLRRQRMEAYSSYARSAKPLATKREDNPHTQPAYHRSPPPSHGSHLDDVGIVHASAISPAIAQLFFQPPSTHSTAASASSSSSAALSPAGHSRTQSQEYGVGSGYGKGRARVSASAKPAAKQTGKRLQPHRTNQYLTPAIHTGTNTSISSNAARPSTTTAPPPAVSNGQSLPSALHAQLNALQHEISQYQAERSRLTTLQHETQRELHLIKQERAQLTARLQQQKADWDKQRTEEERRLKRERVELERRRREAMGWKGSVREERGRMEELEEELGRRGQEWKEKESKYRATIERMRREMRELQAEVREAREKEMKEERRRVDEWERREKDREREKDAERRKKAATASHYHFATVTPSSQPSPATSSTVTSPTPRGRPSTGVRDIVVKQEGEEQAEVEADEADDEKYSTHIDHQTGTTSRTSTVHRSATARSPYTTKSSSSPSPSQPPPHSNTASSPSSLFALPAATSIVSTVHHPANKIEHVLSDRSRLVLFADGTRKHIGVDGSTRVDFPNGDYKISMGRHGSSVVDVSSVQPHTIYYYAGRRVLHRSYGSDGTAGGTDGCGGGGGGMDEYVFEDGQVERHWKDGRKDIQFADGSRKTIDAEGRQTTVWPDDDGKDGTERAARKVEVDGVSVKRWGTVRSNGARSVKAGR